MLTGREQRARCSREARRRSRIRRGMKGSRWPRMSEYASWTARQAGRAGGDRQMDGWAWTVCRFVQRLRRIEAGGGHHPRIESVEPHGRMRRCEHPPRLMPPSSISCPRAVRRRLSSGVAVCTLSCWPRENRRRLLYPARRFQSPGRAAHQVAMYKPIRWTTVSEAEDGGGGAKSVVGLGATLFVVRTASAFLSPVSSFTTKKAHQPSHPSLAAKIHSGAGQARR